MESQPQLPPYTYEPIEPATQIRVLILHPAKAFEDPLSAHIIHRQMVYDLGDEDEVDEASAPYVAVSYSWGTANLDLDLECDGAAVKITPTVDSMLRHLRDKTTALRLWIDAIYISQKDNEEKGIQVQKMGSVFAGAEQVFAWLGEEGEHDDIQTVFGIFKTIYALVELKIGKFNSGLTEAEHAMRYHVEKEIRLTTIKRALNDNNVDAFFKRPWFHRRWIIQEFMLAKNVVVWCGGHRLAWIIVVRVAVRLQWDASWSRKFDYLQFYRGMHQYDDGLQHMLWMLWKCHRSICSDPRDIIYSLYGVTRFAEIESYIQRIPVNYQRDWMIMYVEFAALCIQEGGATTILDHLLSWVLSSTKTKPGHPGYPTGIRNVSHAFKYSKDTDLRRCHLSYPRVNTPDCDFQGSHVSPCGLIL